MGLSTKPDFRNFLFLVWHHLGLPEPTPVQYDMADYLQSATRRKELEAFRGVGKSWITCAFVCWLLKEDPDTKILVVSASKQHADNFSTFVLQLIGSIPELRHLMPRDDQRSAKIQFDVGPAKPARDPSVRSVGINGQLTGSRANWIIGDDIEVPNNSATAQMREKLAEAVKEFDAILKPGGSIVVLGTPQTEQSVYNVLPSRGYSCRIWPARYPNEKTRISYGDRLAPMIEAVRDEEMVGRSTDPRRFSDIDLAERELSYGRSGFALQFMLDTSLSDAHRYPLKLQDLIVTGLDASRGPDRFTWGSDPSLAYNDLFNVGFNGDRFYRPRHVSPECSEYTGSVLAIDPSGSGKDETGYCVVKILHGYLLVTACGGLPGGYKEDNLKALAMIAKTHKVNLVVIEPNFGDGMFSMLLSPVLQKIYPVAIEDTERSSSQKELRIIDTLEPVMNQHRLIIDPKVFMDDYESVKSYPPDQQQGYMLAYQLTRITKDRKALKHDDRLDALALAVHYWTSRMGTDADKAGADKLRDSQDASLRAFLEEADIGVPRERYSAVQLW